MLRDNDEKVIRGYTDKNTKVWGDGREKLVGSDWTKRKDELFKRSGGRCEHTTGPGRRCAYLFARKEMHPHHLAHRYPLRDDRMKNLLAVCPWCHLKLHPEKQLKWGQSKLSEGIGDS